MKSLGCSSLIGLVYCLTFGLCLQEREFTIEVEAGKEECFFEEAQEGDTIDIDYQVVDGGQHNDMTINFRLVRPNGIPVVADNRKGDNTHRHTVRSGEAGDFQVCFDNTISRFSPKVVFFELILEKEDEEDEDGDGLDEIKRVYSEAAADEQIEQYDMKVTDIDFALKAIREKVTQSRHFQDQIRAHEARDRSIAEHNFERVTNWSLIQIVIMILAGFVQVMVLRSLFDEKSYFHALWKKH